MPTVSVDPEYLFELIGRKMTQKEFEDLCFEYGIELDDVVVEDGKEVYRVEVGANRYDLLCAEGIALCLKSFLNLMPFPTFKAVPEDIEIRVIG